MKYKNYNDYELIYMVRENDGDSYDLIFNKYKPIMKRLAYDYYINYKSYGYDFDDFLQEAYVAFYNALDKYDESKNILFYTFVSLCIKRSLLTFCRRISCDKKNVSNEFLMDIDDTVIVDESNIDRYMSYQDSVNLIKKFISDLKIEDSCILELKYNGFSYSEIGILLDLPLRHVQFKGNKIRKIINSNLKN